MASAENIASNIASMALYAVFHATANRLVQTWWATPSAQDVSSAANPVFQQAPSQAAPMGKEVAVVPPSALQKMAPVLGSCAAGAASGATSGGWGFGGMFEEAAQKTRQAFSFVFEGITPSSSTLSFAGGLLAYWLWQKCVTGGPNITVINHNAAPKLTVIVDGKKARLAEPKDPSQRSADPQPSLSQGSPYARGHNHTENGSARRRSRHLAG